MGKKVIRVSAWTCRSVLTLYSKVVTLVFAIFCVFSGLSARTIPLKNESSNIELKGKVLNSADSSVLENIKIYLCSVAYPEYGMGYKPFFSPIDSAFSDSSGNFAINFPDELCSYPELVFVKNDSAGVLNLSNSAFTHIFDPDTVSDTITLYMKPLFPVGVAEKQKPSSLIKEIRRNTVKVKIGNWSANQKYSAKIVNAAGEQLALPVISDDGTLMWNTEYIVNGICFLIVKTENFHLFTRITICN